MNKETLIFSFLITSLLTGLVWLSVSGYIIAVIILSVLTTILIFVAGSLLTIKTVTVMQDRAQQQFTDNAQENMMIMNQLQKVQNLQNKSLMDQHKTLAQLPAKTIVNEPNDALIFDEDIFSEL